MTTEPDTATNLRRPHFGPWIAEYVADRLDSRSSRLLETHTLSCDLCFAALLAEYFADSPEAAAGRTA